MKNSCGDRRGLLLLGATKGSPCRFCEARGCSVGSSRLITPEMGSKLAAGRALGLARVLEALGLRGLSLMAMGLESGGPRGGADGGFFLVDAAFGPEEEDAASSPIAKAPAPGGAGGGRSSPLLIMSKGSGFFFTISTRCRPPCPPVLSGRRPKWYIC